MKAGPNFDAVVIGEPQRAFYGNQFGLTFPVFCEDDILGPLDGWLAGLFTPDRIDDTIRALHEAQEPDVDPGSDDIAEQIKHCDAKLDRYRAALDAGADAGVVATWIADVRSERAALERRRKPQPRQQRMTESEIDAMGEALGGISAGTWDWA